MREESKRWLDQGKADLKSARHCLKSKDYYLCAFMSQQACEKALKALYLKEFKELRKIHDLTFFAKKMDFSQDLIAKCEFLTKAYIETRYADVAGTSIPSEKISKKDAENFLKASSEVFLCIKKKL